MGCTPMGEKGVRRTSNPATPEAGPGMTTVTGADQAGGGALLDPTTRSTIGTYGHAIKANAGRYGVDWRLVLAIMKAESGFSPEAESHKGARGLMQLMPVTGGEVAEKLGIENLHAPVDNIHGGTYYLRELYDLFEGAPETDRLRLALAAYNSGIARVYDAQKLAAYFHDDPRSWQAVKVAMPLLSKRYYTLHRNVWDGGRPPAGWFGNSKETIAYVDNVMEYYDEFRLLLN